MQDINKDPEGYARAHGFQSYAQMRDFYRRQQAAGESAVGAGGASPTQAPSPPPQPAPAGRPAMGIGALFDYIAQRMR